MPTIDQLYGALRQADEDGDTEAAEHFASQIRAARAKPAESSPAPDSFESRAASMPVGDLEIARAKNDGFGQYLRDQASKPEEGETEAETFKRQYGGLNYSGDVEMGEAVAR